MPEEEQSRLRELVAAVRARAGAEELADDDREYVGRLIAEVEEDLGRSSLPPRRQRAANAVTATVLAQHPSLAESSAPADVAELIATLEEIYGDLVDGHRWDWVPQRDAERRDVQLAAGLVCDLPQTWAGPGFFVSLVDGIRHHAFGGAPGLYLGLLPAIAPSAWWLVERPRVRGEIAALRDRRAIGAADGSWVALPLSFDDAGLAAPYDPSRSLWVNRRIDFAAVRLAGASSADSASRFLAVLAREARRIEWAFGELTAGETLALALARLPQAAGGMLLGTLNVAVVSTGAAGSRSWVYSHREPAFP